MPRLGVYSGNIIDSYRLVSVRSAVSVKAVSNRYLSYLRALIFLRLLFRLVLSTLSGSGLLWRWRFWRSEFRIARRKLFRDMGLFGANSLKGALWCRLRCAGGPFHAVSAVPFC